MFVSYQPFTWHPGQMIPCHPQASPGCGCYYPIFWAKELRLRRAQGCSDTAGDAGGQLAAPSSMVLAGRKPKSSWLRVQIDSGSSCQRSNPACASSREVTETMI